MYLPDINLWLGLAFVTHPHHPKAKAWFDGIAGGAVLHFCRLTQQGFLRLSSNPKSLPIQTRTMIQAWAIYDQILLDSWIGNAAEPSGIETVWRQLTQYKTFSHKVWNDAYLAAFAIAGGYELVTFDAGFKQFPGLNCTILT